MKAILTTLFIVIFSTAYSQMPVIWSIPVTISGSVGHDWVRVSVSNSIPVISWGENQSGNIFVSRKVGGNFTTPLQLNPMGFPAVVSGLTGPNSEAKGDTIYLTFIDGGATPHVYLKRSFDGGVTFSDTIRVDNIGADIPQYPSVAILPDGSPIVSFARLTSSFSNPQYVVTKSHDAGSTFLPDVGATLPLSGDPCDCCPGYIACSNNKVAVVYRNSTSNLRDFRAAVSADTANSFSAIGTIDNSGWVIASCPTSGGEGLIIGDTLVSVFMNGLNGKTCYVSTYNMVTNQMGIQKALYNMPWSGSQNLPRIAGSGDTLFAVWEQAIGGSRYIMFSYSESGPAGLGVNVDTISDVLSNAFHSSPDVAYANGKVYVVFSDAVAAQFYYMEGNIGTTGISTLSGDMPDIRITASENKTLNIYCSKVLNEAITLTVHDLTGKLIETKFLTSLQESQSFLLQNHLQTGMYLIRLTSNRIIASQKVMILNDGK